MQPHPMRTSTKKCRVHAYVKVLKNMWLGEVTAPRCKINIAWDYTYIFGDFLLRQEALARIGTILGESLYVLHTEKSKMAGSQH